MSVTFTEKVQQRGEEPAPLKTATKLLEDVLAPSSGRIDAQWDRTEDAKGRTLYILRLADSTGTVVETFTPKDLRTGSDVRYRLIRLYGDLLQVRSHKLLERLFGSGAEESNGP